MTKPKAPPGGAASIDEIAKGFSVRWTNFQGSDPEDVRFSVANHDRELLRQYARMASSNDARLRELGLRRLEQFHTSSAKARIAAHIEAERVAQIALRAAEAQLRVYQKAELQAVNDVLNAYFSLDDRQRANPRSRVSLIAQRFSSDESDVRMLDDTIRKHLATALVLLKTE